MKFLTDSKWEISKNVIELKKCFSKTRKVNRFQFNFLFKGYLNSYCLIFLKYTDILLSCCKIKGKEKTVMFYLGKTIKKKLNKFNKKYVGVKAYKYICAICKKHSK